MDPKEFLKRRILFVLADDDFEIEHETVTLLTFYLDPFWCLLVGVFDDEGGGLQYRPLYTRIVVGMSWTSV
jgi:hypothetical protein